ncbi:ATP-binding protein [Staphylococcus aureus]|nr:ATP-binding protein [Staphylococcus aureus]
MRHGTGNPRQHRSPKDLGRFGLGLKTASFSQCRSLTVVSTRDGTVCGAEWNLDRIDAADDWILSILDDADIHGLPYVERLTAVSGAPLRQAGCQGPRNPEQMGKARRGPGRPHDRARHRDAPLCSGLR